MCGGPWPAFSCRVVATLPFNLVLNPCKMPGDNGPALYELKERSWAAFFQKPNANLLLSGEQTQ